MIKLFCKDIWTSKGKLKTLRWGPAKLPRELVYHSRHMVWNMATILISWGFCNKWPKIWWLKTISVYSVSVLEDSSPKSSRAIPTPGSLGEHLSFPLQLMVAASAFLGFWLHHDSPHLHCYIAFGFSVLSPLAFLLQGHLWWHLGFIIQSDTHLKILNLITSENFFFFFSK